MTEKNIAYILSAFPGYTETFISSEVREIQKLLGNIHLFSLKNLSPKSIVHADCIALKEQTYYSPYLFSPALIKAQLYFLRRRPAPYLYCLFKVVQGNIGKPVALAKTLFIFPKIVYFARIMQSLEVKHIHAHWATIPTTAAFLSSKLLGTPYSFTCHRYDIFAAPNMLQEKIHNAEFVVTVSEYNKNYLKRKYSQVDGNKIHVVHCGVDTEKSRVSGYHAKRQFTLISIGRLVKEKNFDTLIKACRILGERKTDFHCVIAGEGSKRKHLESLIAEYKLSQRVNLVGAVSHERVLALLRESDIFVLPSIIEGIPVSLMEAMAAGLPVVSTAISGIPELVEDSVSGFLVRPEDESALANAIERLVQDEALRIRMGQRGKQKVEAEFNIKNTARMMAELFQN